MSTDEQLAADPAMLERHQPTCRSTANAGAIQPRARDAFIDLLTNGPDIVLEPHGSPFPCRNKRNFYRAKGKTFALVNCKLSGFPRLHTYGTTRRDGEAMDYSYALMDLTVCGRQEPWGDSLHGWPQRWGVSPGHVTRSNGRPIAQWSRLEAGRSDDLAVRP